MTDAELQADLDAIAKITQGWGNTLYAFVILPEPPAGRDESAFVLQSNVGDTPRFLRDAAKDIDDPETVEELPIGASQQ